METCILSSTSTCESDIAAAEASINATLPGELATLLADIHADAPTARIVVARIPRLLRPLRVDLHRPERR